MRQWRHTGDVAATVAATALHCGGLARQIYRGGPDKSVGTYVTLALKILS